MRILSLNGGNPNGTVGGRTLAVLELNDALRNRGIEVRYQDVRRSICSGSLNGIDAVHCHGYQANYAWALTGRRHIRSLTTLHGWLWHPRIKYGPMNWLERKTLRVNTFVFVQSEAMARHLRAANLKTSVRVLTNGISLNQVSTTGSPGSVQNILLLARIAPEKGITTAIRAIALLRLRSAAPKVRLKIVGPTDSPAYLRKCRRLTRALNCEDIVQFQGEVSSPWAGQRPSVLLISSLTEGVPRVLLEAWRERVPVVATQVGGIPEMIVNGRNGVLVPARDQNAMSQALEKCFTSSEFCRDLVTEGARSLEKFSLDRVADEYIKTLIAVAAK
jgi:glycosyltransferase involved in cell wall biosynthesis